MPTLLLISSLLLGGLLALRRYEQSRGSRFAESARRWLDEKYSSTTAATRRAVDFTLEYMHRDVLMKFLHLVSYLALLVVQWIERKLVQVTRFFRSFRRQRKLQDGTEE